ncbi:CHAT domain-containing protein [Flammula alnicola]|nr:CHAT domain-containing protein [Flammula alnicola]
MFYADAVQLTSKDDSQKAIRLNDLGFAHLVRFEHVGDLGDLDISISALKSAVHETRWIDSTRKPEVMDNLCRTLFSRFNRRGDLTDFDEAISTLQNGGYLTLLSSKEEPSPHDAFKYYVEHFNRFEDAMDFAKLALAVKDTADRLFSDNISQDNVRLHNLGLLLEARLMKMDDLGEITESGLAMLEDAAKRLPDTYPKKPTWLHTVAKLLSKHFDRFKINGDLTRAIVMYEDAVRLTSDGHSPYLDVSTSLGFSLLTRFRWLGNLDDLNRSVNALEDAVQLFPDHGQDPDRYLLLNNLGASLLDRFALLRDIGDFNRSAKMFLDAQRSAPPNHTVDAALNIATLLMNRTELVGSLDDINEAIAIYDKNTPDVGHNISNQASDLSYHAMALLHRFRILGDLEDVEKAIQLLDQALKCFQENDYTKAYILKDYAIAFAQRFVRLRNVDDISKCITSLRQAVELTPDFHPFKVDLLFELGRWLPGRFEILRDTQDLEDACSCLSAAASSRTGSIRWKFRAASFWAHCARYFRHGNPMAAYALSMELLPRLAWLGLSIPLRHQQLFEAGEVVVDAVAAAIEQSQYDIAIEWLEQGRSVIWAQLIELRTPAGDLARAHPKLATNLQRLSERLEATSSPTTNPERYHDVAHERDQLIESIRSLEGFGNFLRPKKLEQLLPSARGGPIVTINVSQYRCDVLVLMPNCDEVVHIPLEQFSAADASGLLESLRDVLRRRGALRGSQRARKSPFSKRPKVNPEIVFENILSKLWLCVAKPVLDGVGIKVPSTENMPRIWWCLTGSLAFLPIHAAGLYAPGISSGSKLSDFVVSSYLPSISSLITTGRPRNISKRQVLTVALPIESELPCVQEEIDAIEIAVSDFPVLRLMESDATVENVIAGMKASNFVHFACHGVQNTSVSTESALLLAENAKLSISDIAKLNLPHAELAFLSACQTATGDELLAEESVHLAAGMLSAGFQGVIGTMWSISDNDAPLVAKAVYSHLFRGKAAPDTTEAAHALHVAVKRLQEESPAKKSFLSWVPFIHIGA